MRFFFLSVYLIKTFLFWQFENKTELAFLQHLKNLLYEFYLCLHAGLLRRYFIPRFNLLEVKLTADAQCECLHLSNNVIQCNISILGHCASLAGVWSSFLQRMSTRKMEVSQIEARHSIDNDEYVMSLLDHIVRMLLGYNDHPFYNKGPAIAISDFIRTGQYQSNLSTLVLAYLPSVIAMEQMHSSNFENKFVYRQIRSLDKNISGRDITTNKSWLTMLLLNLKDFSTALKHVCDALSSVPPYALYFSDARMLTKRAPRRCTKSNTSDEN